MYLASFVTTQIDVELAAVQRKLPDCVVVGLQLYSARTFHVTLSPGYIRAGNTNHTGHRVLRNSRHEPI